MEATRAPSSLNFFRIGFAVVLALLAVQIVRLNTADIVAGANPSLALTLDPDLWSARLALVQNESLEDETRSPAALADIRRILRGNPFAAQALAFFGRAAANRGDQTAAANLMNLAVRSNPRLLEANFWLLDQHIRRGEAARAVARTDVLFRGQDDRLYEQMLVSIGPFLTSDAWRQELVALLRTNPPWRSQVLALLARKSTDVAGLNRLFSALVGGANPATPVEMRPLLTRFVADGRYDQAYLMWSKTVPADRLLSAEPIYNARFQYPVTNLPFDWVIEDVARAVIAVSTENARRILNVDFFGGRVEFRNVSHLLALTPGSYTFTGQERAQNLINERGLRWRIACVEKPNEALGATAPLMGEQQWREFRVVFTVPPTDCAYQRLLLELPIRVALDAEIVGGASFTNLGIQANEP